MLSFLLFRMKSYLFAATGKLHGTLDSRFFTLKFVVCLGRILLKKSGTKTPQIELEEVGPSLNLKLRRIKIASEEMYRLARRVPKEAKVNQMKDCLLSA